MLINCLNITENININLYHPYDIQYKILFYQNGNKVKKFVYVNYVELEEDNESVLYKLINLETGNEYTRHIDFSKELWKILL